MSEIKIKYFIQKEKDKYVVYSKAMGNYDFAGWIIPLDHNNFVRECNTEIEALETIRILQ